MSLRSLTYAVVVFFGAFANVAQSEGLVISLKGGVPVVDLNLSSLGVSTQLDEESAFGLNIGYELSRNSTVELELARGTVGFNASSSTTTVSGDIDITTTALYYTQRTDGDLYLALKYGILREEVAFSGSAPSVSAESDVGFSWGLGGGYRINNDFSIEAEYVKVEADVAWVLLSARYRFSQ